MASTLEHHHVLVDGVGKCSKPMWDWMGMPNGFCDNPAYGEQTDAYKKQMGANACYCPGLACHGHGGPSEPHWTTKLQVATNGS